MLPRGDHHSAGATLSRAVDQLPSIRRSPGGTRRRHRVVCPSCPAWFSACSRCAREVREVCIDRWERPRASPSALAPGGGQTRARHHRLHIRPRVWVNGHEWAECPLDQAGSGYTALSKGLASGEDPETLAEICDRFGPVAVQGFFDRSVALEALDRGGWWQRFSAPRRHGRQEPRVWRSHGMPMRSPTEKRVTPAPRSTTRPTTS